MEQKVIQIGNSVGVIIPQVLRDGDLKPGDKVIIEKDMVSGSFIINKKDKAKGLSVSPEFYNWLKRFNEKYKDALKELASK